MASEWYQKAKEATSPVVERGKMSLHGISEKSVNYLVDSINMECPCIYAQRAGV